MNLRLIQMVWLEFHYAAKDDGQVLFYLEYEGEEHVQKETGRFYL